MANIETPGNGGKPEPSLVVNEQKQADSANWQALENDSDFRTLVREKRNVILPLTIIFIVYYFGFLILVGYFPGIVETDVIGHINIAYLFALSQFILAWIIVYVYVRQANIFDKLARSIVNKVKGGQG